MKCSTSQRDFSTDCEDRGIINWISSENTFDQLRKERTTICAMVPAVAPSIRVEDLATIAILRRAQQSGHSPFVLINGLAARLPRPATRYDDGKPRSEEDMYANAEKIEKQLSTVLNADSGYSTVMFTNTADHDRYPRFIVDFLRRVGRQVKLQEMMQLKVLSNFDGMTYTDLSMMVLTAAEISGRFRRYGTAFIGPAKSVPAMQDGLAMVDPRDCDGYHCLAHINPPFQYDGAGNEVNRAPVWISPDMTTPFDFYQFWRQRPDSELEACLYLYTDFPHGEILDILRARNEEPEEFPGQDELAKNVTRIVHGHKTGDAVACAAGLMFYGTWDDIDDEDVVTALPHLPHYQVSTERVAAGAVLFREVLHTLGLCPSVTAARQLIEQGGAYIGRHRITDVDCKLSQKYLISESYIMVRAGKKRHALVQLV